MNKNKKFSLTEVEAATGLRKATLAYRCGKLGFKAEKRYRQLMLTYDQVIQVVTYKSDSKILPPQQSNIDELRLALKNDGYPYKEG